MIDSGQQGSDRLQDASFHC